MATFELFFDDLTKDAQERLLDAAELNDPSEANWDVFPVDIMEFYNGNETDSDNVNDGCPFCGIKYDPSKTQDAEREQHSEVVPGYCGTSLQHGVDKECRPFLMGVGDDYTDYYYPKFCPECGRQLGDESNMLLRGERRSSG